MVRATMLLLLLLLLFSSAWGSADLAVISWPGVSWTAARRHCDRLKTDLADASTPRRNGGLGDALLESLGPSGAENGLFWTSGYANPNLSSMWNWTSVDGTPSNLTFYDTSTASCSTSPLFCTWAGLEPRVGGSEELALAARRRSVDGAMEWFSLPINSTAAAGYLCKTETATLTFSDSATATGAKSASPRSATASATNSKSYSRRADGSSRTHRSASASITVSRSLSNAMSSWTLSQSAEHSMSLRSRSTSHSLSGERRSDTRTFTRRKGTKSISILPARLKSPVNPALLASYMGSSDNISVVVPIELLGVRFFPPAWIGQGMTAACFVVSNSLNNFTSAASAAAVVSWIASSTTLTTSGVSSNASSLFSGAFIFRGNVGVYNALLTGFSMAIGIAPQCTTRPDSNLVVTLSIIRPPDVTNQPLPPVFQQALFVLSLGGIMHHPMSMAHLQQLNFVFDADLCIAPHDGRKDYARLSHFLLPFVSFQIGASDVADYMASLVLWIVVVCAVGTLHLLVMVGYRLRERCSWREARSGSWFPAVSIAAVVSFYQPVVLCATVGLRSGQGDAGFCIASLTLVCFLTCVLVVYACRGLPPRVEFDASMSFWLMCVRWSPETMKAVQESKDQPVLLKEEEGPALTKKEVLARQFDRDQRLACPAGAVRTGWMIAAAQQVDELLTKANLVGSGCWFDKRVAAMQSTCRQAFPILSPFRRSACRPWIFLSVEIVCGVLLSVLDGLSILGGNGACSALRILLMICHGSMSAMIIVFAVYRTRLHCAIAVVFHLSIFSAAAGGLTGADTLASIFTILAAVAVMLRSAIDCVVLFATALLLKGSLRNGIPCMNALTAVDVDSVKGVVNADGPSSLQRATLHRRWASEEDFVMELPDNELPVVSLGSMHHPAHRPRAAARGLGGEGRGVELSDDWTATMPEAFRLKQLDAIL